MTILAGRTACKPVSCINLHTWLSCVHLHHTAALRCVKLAAELDLSQLVTVDNPAVIVSLTDLQRLEISLDILSDRLAVYEVHRSSCNRCTLSKRDLRRICRKILGSIQCEDMAEDISVTLTVEVEICVICKVDHCRSIRLCSQCETKLALLSPLVTRNCLYRAGISLLTILRIIHELYSTLVLAAFPNLVLESLRTSMKMVRTIVHWKRVLGPVKGELSESDTVCIAARNLA